MKKVLLQNLADGKWGQLLLVTIGYFLLFKTDKIPEIAIHHLTHFGTKATQSLITFFTRASVHQSNQVASFQFTVID